ncbi:unnamed protein product, partial [Brassica rapa]
SLSRQHRHRTGTISDQESLSSLSHSDNISYVLAAIDNSSDQ